MRAATDGTGNFALSGLPADTYTLTASSTDTQIGRSITAASALAALRVAVGGNPNPATTTTTGNAQNPVSPYQIIASDFDGNGRVSAADALAILRAAVGQTGALAPKFVFVNETQTYYDPGVNAPTITTRTVPTTFTATQTVAANAQANFVAVLTGDVLGRYVPRDGTGTVIANPPTLPTSRFITLSAATGAPPWTWGVTVSNTLAIGAGLARDTGPSATDFVTSDPTVTGQVASGVKIATFKGGFDATIPANYADLSDTLGTNGAFTLSAARLATLYGGTIPDGTHVLHLTSTDVNGTAAQLDFTFTLIAAQPTISSIKLSSASGDPATNTTAASSVTLSGTATPGLTVTVAGQSGTAVANGTFTIQGVKVVAGANALTATATDLAGHTATASITITQSGTVSTDQALIWNQIVLDTIKATSIYPEDASRVMAMVALAQYDTLAAIQGTPSYLVSRTTTGAISTDIALARAADTVLSNLFPSFQPIYDAALAQLTATVADGTAKTAALALGSDIGQTVYNIRATDGSTTYIDDKGSQAIGKWRPTAPMYLVAEDAQWGGVTPFALTSGTQFRAPAPPDVTSAQYAADLNQVQSLGSATSTTRTADQTQQAQFWADGRGSYTPAGHWVAIAEQVALARGNSLADNVKLFAQLGVALADSAIAAWDTKYFYNTWRPIDAIHNADQDNNAATTVDPNWTPLITTPAHPDYVSGHSTFSAAAAAVLANAFGDNTSFTTTSQTLLGVTRSYTSFTQAADEAGLSRIYAGIHTASANNAGHDIGVAVAGAVLTRFAQTTDTQAPTIIVPPTAAAYGTNPAITGQIIDNLSGVTSASYKVDGGAAQAITLDAQGNFRITTALATDGSADGTHTVAITARDKSGNVTAPFVRSFVLDTVSPAITLTSLANGDALTDTSRLTGIASPTGSSIVAFTLAVDGGKAVPLAVNTTTGAFDIAYPASNLGLGTHSLVLTATDAAGNTGTLTRSVVVSAYAAFKITGETPAPAATDVGVTQRPQIYFSRQVNSTTLTSASYYATAADGTVIPTTVVPSADGSFAWLFWNTPQPGGQKVTVHVDGSLIRAAADGTFLDAAGTGTAGSMLTFTFTTVATSSVTGTKLVGRAVDPGPDNVPNTFDDVRRGPDGIIHTLDDVYLNPIAGATVTIIGRPDLSTVTDANGLFTLDNVPAGDVKVVIDGRVATNSPTGFFFPEMVIDANFVAGATNTIESSHGTDANKLANAGFMPVYLPRIPLTSLQTVASTGTTTVTPDQNAAPGLTTDQRASLTLTIAAGSAVDATGQKLGNVQLGVSTVDPTLIKDELPPGILQHTFDITIQAPGVSTFTTPIDITFPNVFNAAPGSKLNILSFDHTTGRLVINGTGTVSVDGKTVVSDPGQGVKAPGWHGLAPPGGPGTGNGPNDPNNPDPNDPNGPNNLKNALHAFPDIFNGVLNDVSTIISVANIFAQNTGQVGFLNALGAGADLVAAINDFGDPKKDGLDKAASIAKFGLDVLGFVPGPVGLIATGARVLWGVADGYIQYQNLQTTLATSEANRRSPGGGLGIPNFDTAAPIVPSAQPIIDQLKVVAAEFQVQQPLWAQLLASADAVLPILQLAKTTPLNLLTADQRTTLLTQTKLFLSTAAAIQARPDFTKLSVAAYVAASKYLTDTVAQLFQSPSGNGTLGTTGAANDLIYAALTTTDGFVDRFTFARGTGFTRSLGANLVYKLDEFDPSTGHIGTVLFQTGDSGSNTSIPTVGLINDTATIGANGLTAFASKVIGVNGTKLDNLVPGIADAVVLKQGKTTATQSLATGIISSATLKGTSQAVATVASLTNPAAVTAYVATGAYGLGIVDVSSVTTPVIQSQLSLPGFANDVGYDQIRGLAVVASGDAGVSVVDVSNPTAPKLLQQIALDNTTTRLALLDGIAYVTNGTAVSAVDIVTGEIRATLDLGGQKLADIGFSGPNLFALDKGGKLTAIGVTGDVLTKRGSITLAASGGRLTLGGNVAYASGGEGFGAAGGYETVDITNPDTLTLLSGTNLNTLAGGAIALNGSGLGVLVGVSGRANALDVVNTANPATSNAFLSRIALPDAPTDIAIANGRAYVTLGASGLQIINYVGIDTKGVAPTVSLNLTAADADPATPGIQVVEGGSIRVVTTTTDDVQIRNVQLLVNGVAVANDASYPFDFSVAVPSIAKGGTSITLQAIATDTGGNITRSAITTLTVVRDTFPPTVASVTPADNASVFFVRSAQVVFDKPIDTTKLSTAGVTLVNVGPDGVAGTADDIKPAFTLDTRANGQVLAIIPSAYLAPGVYKLTIAPSIIFDRAGNQLAAPITRTFTIRAASAIRATTGVPAVSVAPSANPGQLIGLPVPFDPTTAVATFQVIDINGTKSTRDVGVSRADGVNGVAYFVVPVDALTGDTVVSSLVGTTKTSFADGTFFLQVVPTATSLSVTSVASDGTSVNVTLKGRGLIEGNGTIYNFGTTAVADGGSNVGPDVVQGAPDYVVNGTVNLTLPLTDGAFGPVSVTTAGGTSAAFTSSIQSITAAAFSGTPADPTQASANGGQAVVLNGNNLGTGTTVLIRYVDSTGTARLTSLSPILASADGTRATLVVPTGINGVARLQTLGSANQPILQIVPTVTGFSVGGGNLQLQGTGFVEGAGTYAVGNATVVDTAIAAGPDVVESYPSYVGNGTVNITEPVHGFGTATVTTAAGTSAPFAVNEARLGYGYLRDVAVDTTTGATWVIDNANPGVIHKVDTATGADLLSVTLTDADYGSTYDGYGAGLSIAPADLSLGGTIVPKGSVLFFHATPNPDRVFAINPTTGNIVATLTVAANYDTTGGAYDATNSVLYMVDRRANPARIVTVDPISGNEIASFPVFTNGETGLAFDSRTGTLWYGSDTASNLYNYSTSGTLLRVLNVGLQGVPGNQVTGIAFDPAGKMILSTTEGVLYKVDPAADPAAITKATLTGLVSTAPSGTAANTAVASANVGQVLELTGTNFGTNTQVVFQTRDNDGNTGVIGSNPLVVNAAGTKLQVIVPDLATTGGVSVVNVAKQDLGFASGALYNDAVYRKITLTYTPAAANSTITWRDLGLEPNNNENWGIDNVVIAQNGATVFADDFQGGAKANWSDATTDNTYPGTFSQFSGRFNNSAQNLSLTGLAVGKAVTITFDLYALDSLDGTLTPGPYGSDYIDVRADGALLFHNAFVDYSQSQQLGTQTFGLSAPKQLQIVPTLTSTGQPGTDGAFTLTGTGFQEGASTITIGGRALVDTVGNFGTLNVTGAQNGTYAVTAPLTVEGPVTVTTAGGSATLPGPSFAVQPTTLFTGITTVAATGAPASAAAPSANVGQSITLTGASFTNSTLVQFTATDDTGFTGVVTRTGSASSDGKTLTVTVPVLARTGKVTVLGSGTSQFLQIVPILRGVGGAVQAGGLIELDGTGLVNTEISVTVDGLAVGQFTVRTIADINPSGVANPQQGQQLLTIAVPQNITAGVITITTAGGSYTVRPNVSVASTSVTPAADVGDTLATATAVALATGNKVTYSDRTNNGAAASGLDVDLYKLSLTAGDQLTLSYVGASYGQISVFDAAGKQLTTVQFAPNGQAPLLYVPPSTGTYYIGVSGYGNSSYKPADGTGGTASGYLGTYSLGIERLGGGDSRFSLINVAATTGTPALPSVASANVGQTITITGNNLVTGEKVAFSAIDISGLRYYDTVTAASVAGDGKSLTVVVPQDATTGTVRLARDPAGLLLQIVPKLTRIDSTSGTYAGGNVSLTGTGFAEGATTVNIGTTQVVDTSRSDGIDVTYGAPNYLTNTVINLTTPTTAPTGPYTVTTVGGTSAVAGPVFAGITATATTGLGASSAVPSANPGQAITVTGSGFDSGTAGVFPTIDISGAVSQTIVRPIVLGAGGTSFTVVVPVNALTGQVGIVGDQSGTKVYLQIVPIITGITVTSVAGDGSSANVTLSGLGFVEGNNSLYTFGTTVVADPGIGTGPDVTRGPPSYVENGIVNLTVPLSNGAFGPVTVTTAGGTTAAYAPTITSIVGTALSGTPADAAQASANTGQAITLVGTGLGTATNVLFRYLDSAGNPHVTNATPSAAAQDGTSATLLVPAGIGGAAKVWVFGAANAKLLQIVPTVNSFAVSPGNLQLLGTGYVEGSGTYKIANATVVDTSVSAGPDVVESYPGYVGNGTVNIPDPVHGFGSTTVTTAGGTSAPFATTEANPGLGYLRDVAVNRTDGSVWVIDNANPARVLKIDPATGATLLTVTLTDADFGSAYPGYGEGLSIAQVAFKLGSTTVPAGSVLLFNAAPNPDRVIAIDPSTGNVISSLVVVGNYDSTGGTFDPSTGHLWMINRNVSPARIVEVDPVSGAELSSFVSFSNGETGLTLDPTNNTLWYGVDGSGQLYNYSKTGTLLRVVQTTLQSVTANAVTGIAFDAQNNMILSSSEGVLYKVNPNADPAAIVPATLTGITANATAGTPASAGTASANVGQVITLTGTNFGSNTQVVFPTLDNTGVAGVIGQAPIAINAAGTQLQVLVPDLASTGAVKVTNVAKQNYGFASYNDAIYRGVTLTTTPAATTSIVTFTDDGLEGVGNESWGIDNVVVRQNGVIVFQDNFEGGAKSNWSDPTTDGSLPGIFSQFSGRFSGASQKLTLTGLTAGQPLTISYDLYAIDSLDGTYTANPAAGPDYLTVLADGTRIFHEAFVNYNGAQQQTQTYGLSQGIQLQVVPTLTATGQPGTDGFISLTGSGFQEGASTIRVGAVTFNDTYTNQGQFDVTGTQNDTYRITVPLTVEGPVSVTTAGGTATIAGPVNGPQPPAQFTGITAAATAGTAKDSAKPSANVGQVITLAGQGFTTATKIAFTGQDDAGGIGAITRTGTPSADGTSLTIAVPELAKTGAVTVLGSGASFPLQIVPSLRGIGGAITAGNQVLGDGTGLLGPEIVVNVDNIAAGTFSVRSVADLNPNAVGSPQNGSQLLSFTVPAGISAGVVTITTAGGSFTFRAGVATAASTLNPAADVGDTLATSLNVALNTGAKLTISSRDNDGTASTGKDVDLYQVALNGGDQLTIGYTGGTYGQYRVFDPAGKELLTVQANPSGTTPSVFVAPGTGLYYVGVSGYGNSTYNPATANSGTVSGYLGVYTLMLERLGGGDTRLASITTTATIGTPAQSTVPSANVGQTITITGAGLVTGDTVQFSGIDSAGSRFWITRPATVAANGLSLTAVVPDQATTGTVRLSRDPAGLYLQIVPTLTHLDSYNYQGNTGFIGAGLTFTGTGYTEGASLVRFGSSILVDTGRAPDWFDVVDNAKANGGINVIVPNGVATGPLSVTTQGGTSNQGNESFTGITATLGTGTAANGSVPAVNPGATITLNGTNFDLKTDVVFEVIDTNGVRSQLIVQPTAVGAGNTTVTVVVPNNAVTGRVRVVGDLNATEAPLQIVPVVTAVVINSIAGDGSSANVTLSGTGFIEGNNTLYTFGTVTVPDPGIGTGPDVVGGGVNLIVPLASTLTGPAFGAITVTTAGGTSAALTGGITSITAVATSGTPADATQASANTGQTIALTGTGLTKTTQILFRYVSSDGNPHVTIINPATATADGTGATMVVPAGINGAARLWVFGSSTQPLLQIVPTVASDVLTGGNLQAAGTGFAEAASTYTVANKTVVDTAANAGPDVFEQYPTYVPNGTVNIPELVHGYGSLVVTTAGGSSAAYPVNYANPGFGYLRDVAVDPTSNATWTIDNASPAVIHKINLSDGTELQKITLTDAGYGSSYDGYGAGLSFASAAFNLNGVSIPRGTMLVFNTYSNTISAVNPATGTVLAKLVPPVNYAMTGGVYDAVSGNLFITDRRANPTRIVSINPATGAFVATFDVPYDGGENGLAIDSTGNIWLAEDNTSNLKVYTTAGTLVKTVDLASQGIANEITGIAFDGGGKLIASSSQGVVYRLTV